MPLHIEEIIDSITNKITDNRWIQSPIWTAVIIVILLLMTIWYVIHNEVDTVYEDTSMMHLYAKIGIWSMIVSIVVVFLHNKSVNRYYEEKYKSKEQEKIVEKVVAETKVGPPAKI